MSIERDVIHEMIEERESQVRALHQSIDRLYDKYDSQAMVLGGYKVHDQITRLYDEILLLKMVLMKADEPIDTDQLLIDVQEKFGVSADLLEEEFSDEGRA